MAPVTYLLGLKVAVTVAFIFSITILPPKSGKAKPAHFSKKLFKSFYFMFTLEPKKKKKNLKCMYLSN